MATDTTNGVPLTTAVAVENDLNAPITFSYDKVFENLVESIVPSRISDQNKALIDSFVDILADFSPISINIIDAFNKQKKTGTSTHSNHIEGVQEGFAQMYLENFWSVVEKAKTDYVLNNRLQNILSKYEVLDGGSEIGLQSNLKFFGNINELFTEERFVLGRDFKEKKGTATAIEYAYKLGWLAEIEGPLRDAYAFELISNECTGGIPSGMVIACENPFVSPGPDEEGINYPSANPCTGFPFANERFINNFYINDVIDGEDCTPFSYEVEGSMIPAMFEAFVIPLSHPVGFSYGYAKILELAFEDYFNLEYIYKADKVSVNILCPNGDCSRASEDVYATKTGIDSISGSTLKYFDSGDIYQGEFKGWKFEKYIFANGSYLISYKTESGRGVVEEVVQYFAIADLDEADTVVQNGDFEEGVGGLTDWYNGDEPVLENPPENWNVIDGIATYSVTDDVDEDDKMSQNIVLKEGVEYNIEFNAILQGRTHDFRIKVGNVVINVIGSGVQRHQIVIPANNDGRIEIWGSNSEFTDPDPVTLLPIPNLFGVDDIKVTPLEATVTYPNYTHSAIVTDNPSAPVAVLYTHDIFDVGYEINLGNHTTIKQDETVLHNGDFEDPIGTYWTTTGTAWSQVIVDSHSDFEDVSEMVFRHGDDTSVLTQPLNLTAGKEYEIKGKLVVSAEDDNQGNPIRDNYLVIDIEYYHLTGNYTVRYEVNTFGIFSFLFEANADALNISITGRNDVDAQGATLTLQDINILDARSNCENIVVNSRFNVDGGTIINNGDFEDPIGDYWTTTGTHWTQEADIMKMTDGDNSSLLTQLVNFESGKEYEIKGVLQGVTTDDYLTVLIDGTATLFEFNNFGVFRATYTANGTETKIDVSGKNDITSQANFSLLQIEISETNDLGFHAWSAGAGWSVQRGVSIGSVAVHTVDISNPTSEVLRQRIFMKAGNTYRINFDMSFQDTTAKGTFKIGGEAHTISGTGKGQFEFTAKTTQNYDIEFYGATTFSIDNVYVDCNKDLIADEMKSLYSNKLAIIGFDLYIAQAQLNVDVNVTQEGGFIIGGIILPHGDISTQYMFDDLSYVAEGQVWINAIDPINFIEPNNWQKGIGWDIIEGANPTLNYADCDGSQTGWANLSQEFELANHTPPIGGHTDEHFVMVNFDLTHEDTEDVPGFVRVYSNIESSIIEFHDTGSHSYLMKYSHTGSDNQIRFEASYNTSFIGGNWNALIGTVPTTGEVALDDGLNPTLISYYYIDADGNDNQTKLDGVTAGDIITIKENLDALRDVVAEVLLVDTAPTGYVTYTVNVINSGNEIRDGFSTITNIPQAQTPTTSAGFVGRINNVTASYILGN